MCNDAVVDQPGGFLSTGNWYHVKKRELCKLVAFNLHSNGEIRINPI